MVTKNGYKKGYNLKLIDFVTTLCFAKLPE